MKKLALCFLGALLVLFLTGPTALAAQIYQVTQTIPVYQDSQSALNKTGPTGTYAAGTYYVFTTSASGMINITRTEGTAGAWINPEQNGTSGVYRTVSALNGLNLRSGPGTAYAIILKIPYGQSVELLESGTTWSKVAYSGKSGYVSSAYLEPAKAPTSYPIYYTTSSVNFRTGPGSSYSSYGLLPSGTAVQYISGGTWSKVSHNGKTGYILSSYLSKTAPSAVSTTPYYTTASVNFRSGPGASYQSLGLLPSGTQVGLISTSGTWSKVVYGGKTGYISSSYLTQQTPSLQTTPYLTRSSVNLRTGPGTSYPSIRLLASGTEVGLLSAAGTWSKVTHLGRIGYVASSYLIPKAAPEPAGPKIGIAWFGTSSADKYTSAVKASGGQVLYLPQVSSLSEAQAALSEADGVLFIGGGDFDASYYGEENSPFIERVDPERDRSEYWTLRAALDRDLPILGICRGLQWINVVRGGSLYQDTPTEYGTSVIHRDPERKTTVYHDILIKPETKLSGILGSGRLSVNSLHHQSIKTLGDGLIASAHSEDGLIEAIEATDRRFVVGVQFHPENLYAQGDTLFLSLFKRLVSEAK